MTKGAGGVLKVCHKTEISWLTFSTFFLIRNALLKEQIFCILDLFPVECGNLCSCTCFARQNTCFVT